MSYMKNSLSSFIMNIIFTSIDKKEIKFKSIDLHIVMYVKDKEQY